jgi:TRAP-type C4-dicarboxylate transport system substrate-binding protein
MAMSIRHFFFKEPVNGIEDLKGKKIRVSSDPTMTGMVDDLGGSATTVAFTELYSALSTGVVDGAEQPTANYKSNTFNEVAPYLILDGHTLGVMQIVIADYSWDKLDEQQREWLMEASRYASAVCREKVAEIEARNFELLRKEGVTVIEVDDKEPWVNACRPTIERSTGELSALYEKILAMK